MSFKRLFFLAFAIACGAARAASPIYNPASPTASMDERMESWNSLKIKSPYEGGAAVVGRRLLSAPAQGNYYQQAGAADAVDHYRKAREAQTQGIVWIAASPGVGALAGAIVGATIGSQQAHGYELDRELTIVTYEIEGIVVGAVVGLAVGASVALGKRSKMLGERKKAADSFNQKLLRDLNIQVAPEPGGAAVNVEKKF